MTDYVDERPQKNEQKKITEKNYVDNEDNYVDEEDVYDGNESEES